MAISDDLAAYIVTREFQLLRVAAGLQKDALAALEELESDIVDKINRAAGKSDMTQARLNALLDQTQRSITKAYKDLAAQNSEDLGQIASTEANGTADWINGELSAQIMTVAASDEQLQAVADKTLIMGHYAKDLWEQQGQATQDRFAAQMRLGVLSGESIGQLVSRVRGTKAMGYADGIMAVSRRHAETLVRTSVISVANEARLQMYRDNSDVVKGIQWVSTLDSRTTLICFDGATKAAPIGRLMKVFRRAYKGDVLIITTASGQQITVTPNHPVLTPGGWRNAEELKPCDKIVNALLNQGVSIADNMQMHPTFAALADSVFHPSISNIFSKRAAPTDFHGDGMGGDEEIEIAILKSELRNGFNPHPVNSLEYNALNWLHSTGALTATSGLGALRFCGLPIPEPSQVNALAAKDGIKTTLADREHLHDFGWAQPILKQADGFTGRAMLRASRAVVHKADTFEERSGSSCSSGISAGDFSGGNTGAEKFADVVSVRREYRAFHVYNLETSQGVYSAGGFIVKNCRALDGLMWDLDYRPIGHSKAWPGPTAHINCRSTQISVLKSWQELADEGSMSGPRGGASDIESEIDREAQAKQWTAEQTAVRKAQSRASMDGQVAGNLNYEDFLRTKGKAFQDEVLGPGRADLWRAGKVTLQEMTNQTNRPLTIEQLKSK